MIQPAHILSAMPNGLRTPLLQSYAEITRNYTEHRWEPAELNGGKFSEVVYSFISGTLTGNMPSTPSKPRDMVAACRALENIAPDAHRTGDRSLRILIPRVLQALYEIRNNRGVGHAGGDVDPNFLDSTAVHAMSSWVLAELIRVFHNVTTHEAQEAVDAIIERKHPLIWQFEETRRVLDTNMSKRDQALVLLHAHPGWVAETDLLSWVEYSSATLFRTRILKPLHKSRLVEYQATQRRVRISPLGVAEAEKHLNSRNG